MLVLVQLQRGLFVSPNHREAVAQLVSWPGLMLEWNDRYNRQLPIAVCVNATGGLTNSEGPYCVDV